MQGLRIVLVGLVIAIAALLGWHAWNAAAPARQAAAARPPFEVLPRRSGLPAGRRSIETRLAEAHGYAAFLAAFKRAFPADYKGIIAGFAARAAESGHSNSPDLYLSEILRRLRQTRGALAAQAEAGPLGQMFTVQAQILARLAETAPPLCVDFLYGGASEAFIDFSAKNRALIAAMGEAALDAILDGQAHKISRPAPTVEDFDELEKALVARGLDRVEIGALLDGKMPDPPLPAPRMCTAGRAYLDALQNLPQDARLKMFALAVELMARS